MRRATRLRASLVKRRSVILARLDSYLELLGPAWHAAFGGDPGNNTPLRFLAAGYAGPHALRRLGRARLTRFIWRYSHGAWGDEHASRLLAAAEETLQLRDGELSFTGLVPSLTASGVNGRHGPPAKSGDAPLREALFIAADTARRTDPTLAAR
jgi:hypothetical protein